MRTLTPLLLFVLFALPAQGQLPTTDLNDFDRPDSTRLGETRTVPTSLSAGVYFVRVQGSLATTTRRLTVVS